MHHRRMLRNLGRRFRKRTNACPCVSNECYALDKLPEGTSGTISCNNNLRTIERGLFVGMQISIFRNDPDEPNLIVAVGDARYVLDRRLAKEIRVRAM